MGVSDRVWIAPTGRATTLLGIIPFVFLIVAIDFPLVLACHCGTRAILGKTQSHSLRSFFESTSDGHHFRLLFGVVFVEELFFRWFLLGQGSKLSLFSGNAFYVLLIASNLFFAYVHLANYKDLAERQWARVLPQFMSGLLLSFVFVRYGLVASVFAHFAMNSVLFSLHKIQNTSVIDFVRIVVHFVYAFAALHVMDKPISDTLVWFSAEPTFALPGWLLGDYVAFGIFFGSTLSLLADVLLYDKNLPKQFEKTPSIPAFMIVISILVCLMLGLQYGLYWLLHRFISDFVLCILTAAVFMSMLTKNASLSAAQRTFWVGIPSCFVSFCIYQALGFKLAFCYIMICVLITIPQIFLEFMDD
ncbi:hypothetical protein A3C09_02710 [Candidatus Uhrbacteria bacterium RIFCSPHIGHO2_02_FULL_47_44]|uniref:CAAX prenyl protease 2/Lysostaphin resistance protein A-like domain-containing protein n=1 Tax=Candidatus Uhrbacteria bacterium RIFCSPLOWO2_02_FULL_48_18 TaxID=1802408 RepID=A0A1F7V8C0_9BACT|nr:MAG: hypothetical protein A2839_00110 [Candidatus Uhrbacteria bacterium RIFCSPHIGHO2_01_FULL_47_10]OGL70209.1 MAG: hypothetical protein A3C09_02710 [Candidatus Uhrbacteria bacterium RIFCSPHIGHO2_02_FULL_47_44]OGL77117.1 MAG: hypothetical protein A3E97_03455 [Candidatus Uhrbacteria bacterium RIFCSPHIGHO2_12_FULL_47_12]OGL80458.1 MAG: hypothetical protein A3B20_03555 [Candidatus Uhrbacteria bacterium RIFCSPLOWO2_01_FULL_47_17]OGL86318.1 MAG: hypothetical protein A3I41_02035 [Candidatus Uhrbact